MNRKKLFLLFAVSLLCIGSVLAYRVAHERIRISFEVVDYQIEIDVSEIQLGKLQKNTIGDYYRDNPYSINHTGNKPIKLSYSILYLPSNISFWIMIRLENETEYTRLEPEQIWNQTIYPSETCYFYIRMLIDEYCECGKYDRVFLKFWSNPI
jgi:hypothetical protein